MRCALFPFARTVIKTAFEDAAAFVGMAADEQIVEHGHALEERYVLEGACQSAAGALVGLQTRDVLARKDDLSLLRAVHAADGIEQAGLARTVGADDGVDGALLDLEAHVLNGGDAAEAQRHVTDLQLSGAHRLLPLPLVIDFSGSCGNCPGRNQFHLAAHVQQLAQRLGDAILQTILSSAGIELYHVT